jgi:hypothetical protein
MSPVCKKARECRGNFILRSLSESFPIINRSKIGLGDKYLNEMLAFKTVY